MNRRSASHEATPFSQGPRMPHRMTRSASSIAAQQPQLNLAALIDSPARQNMPHLHPHKLNGSLWFDDDDCIDKDITAICQADFWGQWWNYNMIPQSTKDAWWSSFVQKYYWDNEHHDEVFACWKHLSEESMGKLFSKRKRSGKKLDYTWETEVMVKKSKTELENLILDKEELVMHLQAKISKAEAGEKSSPTTELVRMTHTEEDGSLVDKRATVLVTATETLATQQSTSNESDAVSEAGSTATGPSRHQPNVAHLVSATATPHKVDMNKLDTTSHYQNLDFDMRMSRIEEIMSSLKLDLETLKLDVKALKQGIDAILRVYGIDPVTLQPMGSLATPPENSTPTTGPTP
ncbi:PREDICTED: uncharacterized protein LOC104787705 [Camelina sativa]|uniref:Uncharacterized protein LOC104787705 n=1 Tax=Camelina sativa TaxID=90675 RepID=A0ABM0Z7S1_CAMSA|nr:PREDICTED: uncharacterized protein LOC104787705 [Camelina sativa]XP_010511615.1 PREDICTED: uncharacterized protein LOC104787705 [Camelina sativa]